MKKILIADDEHKIIMTLEYAFRKAGYEVFIPAPARIPSRGSTI